MTLIQKIQKLRAKKGFTLVELIVVIAILAVLMAILIPTMMNFVENSRIQSANTTAKNYFDTTKQYVTETEAAAKGVLKDTSAAKKGDIVLLFKVANTDGKTAVFTISADTKGVDAAIEGTTTWTTWSDGLKAHLQEQMPNADDSSFVLVEIKTGAVVQTVYSKNTLAIDNYATVVGTSGISEGKYDGAITGSSPVINGDGTSSSTTTP